MGPARLVLRLPPTVLEAVSHVRSTAGINVCSPNPVCEADAYHDGPTGSAMRRRTMKTLVTALALALVIVPALSQSAAAAARKRDGCQWQQNENCYYRGYPLWQRYSN
jgi:hypothetical protein